MRPADILFSERWKRKKEGLCTICHCEIVLGDFTDKTSLKEYTISGMCQKCQDEFFGGDEGGLQ